MTFENSYLVTKERYKNWVRHPVKKAGHIYKTLWILLFIVTLYLSVSSVVKTDTVSSYIFILLSLLCVYQAFIRDIVIANRKFKLLSKQQEADQWQRTVILSDNIEVREGKLVTEFTFDQISELIDLGEYYALGIGTGRDVQYLRLLKNAFVEKTDEDFLDFFKREHEDIPIG